jgi:hypothetical protein
VFTVPPVDVYLEPEDLLGFTLLSADEAILELVVALLLLVLLATLDLL